MATGRSYTRHLQAVLDYAQKTEQLEASDIRLRGLMRFTLGLMAQGTYYTPSETWTRFSDSEDE